MSGTIIGAHRAKHAGDSFEAWMEIQHAIAIRRGILAWVRHVSPRVKWVGHGKAARPIVTGEAAADYVGQLAGGRSLVVEAKSWEPAKHGGRFKRCLIKPQQIKQLDACAANGGLALLALEARILGARCRFIVPWQRVPWEVVRTAQTLTAAALEGWEAAPGCYLDRWNVNPWTLTRAELDAWMEIHDGWVV